MRWKGRKGSSNVEDRRGMPVRGAVGGGVGMLAVVLIAMLFGVDPSALLEGGGAPGAGAPNGSVGRPAGEMGVPDDEGGHHVQNLTGTMDTFQGYGASGPGSSAVRMELQADCYAGLWSHDQRERGFLEPGDIDEALNAAAAIGDDALQRRGQGTVVPESFTHGTSEQRARWFRRGYESGDPARCDTFTAQSL